MRKDRQKNTHKRTNGKSRQNWSRILSKLDNQCRNGDDEENTDG